MIVYRCKWCKKLFRYDEGALQPWMEDGESEPQRCPECRQTHGKESREYLSPYAKGRRVEHPVSPFLSSDKVHTFHGDRKREHRVLHADSSDMKLGIAEEDIAKLYAKLEENQVVVVVSETGSGKSTFLPARLLIPPLGYTGRFVEHLMRQGQIAITQPRIPAVQRIPETIAKKYLGSAVGPDQRIGYRHGDRRGGGRGEQWNRFNQAVVVTDGTLRNWLMEGHPGRYSLIMVDEAHERSVNIDVILGLLKIALKKYPHLRVIISSATINKEKFLETFREVGVKADLLEIPSRKEEKYFGPHCWKADERIEGCECWLCSLSPSARRAFWARWRHTVDERSLPDLASRFALELLERTTDGGILVFLHGQRAIKDTEKLLQSSCESRARVVALYADLGEEEVEQRLQETTGTRRVILATNIAETSLTLTDIVYIIDSGFIKELRFGRLVSRRHSRDGCRQRWGRAGRVRTGYVYALYTHEEFERFDEHTTPEIVRQCLDDALITAKAAGITDITEFRWVDSPSEEESARAEKAVRHAGTLDAHGDIGEHGLEVLHIPRPATEAALLLAADAHGCLFEALSVLLATATRDGSARIGENFYDRALGLLRWDLAWTAREKMHTFAVQSALSLGCQDDVVFLAKLVDRFAAAHEAGNGEEWASARFVHHAALLEVVTTREELLERFREAAHDEGRQLKLERLKLVRHLIRTLAPEVLIAVRPHDEEVPDDAHVLSLDQEFAIRSWVSVDEREGKTVITGLAGSEGSARSINGEWLGTEKRAQGRLVTWRQEQDGSPVALLSPFSESEIRRFFQEKRGVAVEMIIHRTFRDPLGAGGWTLAATAEGMEVVITSSSLSFSHMGYGVEHLEGHTLSLTAEGFDEDGWPELSYLDRLVEDLRTLRQQGTVRMDGSIVAIAADKESVIVAVPREGGIVHCFDVHRDFVPGSTVTHLEIGEAVVVRISPKRALCRLAVELQADEATPLPKDWVFDPSEGTLSFPCCMEKHIARSWKARADIADLAWRHSWRYGFNVVIELLTAHLPSVEPGDPVTGRVTRMSYEGDGKTIKSVDVLLDDGTPGFVFREDLVLQSQTPSEGETLPLEVLKVDRESGFLRLTGKVRDPYRALRPGDLVGGKIIGLSVSREGRFSGVVVEISVDTPRGTFPAEGFVPVSELGLESPGGEHHLDTPSIGATLELSVLEVYPEAPRLVLRRQRGW